MRLSTALRKTPLQIHPARRSLSVRALQQRLDGLKLFVTDVAPMVFSRSPSFSHLWETLNTL